MAMDASFWNEVARAKRMTGSQRLTESLRLSDEAAERMLAGIKSEFPGISDGEARSIRRERIDSIWRIESLPPPAIGNSRGQSADFAD